MTCPSCRESVPSGCERCPACGAGFTPIVEGALAPDPSRSRVEPLRELPGLRKKERTWKDEVRERVRERKRTRAGEPDLPLFPDPEEAEEEEEARARPEGPPPSLSTMVGERRPPYEEDDLPLRPREEMPAPAARPQVQGEAPEELEEPAPEHWMLRPTAGGASPQPVERPARSGERAQAALLDLALLSALSGVIVYFAGRAAHVELAGLRPAWPYLGAYLAFLALMYAAYFTGATGQTLGKVATGLQVVDASGRPPGFVRALARALLGTAGVLLAGSGLLPMFVDPARRGFHDRVLKTRVIRK